LLADVLTKALAIERHERLTRKMAWAFVTLAIYKVGVLKIDERSR